MPEYDVKVIKSVNFNEWLFLGVIFHEISHAFFSVILGSKIKKTHWWDKKEASVVHEEAEGIRGYLISTAPFILGTIFAGLFIYLGQQSVQELVNVIGLLKVLVFYYLGLSIAYHSFPSKKDTDNAKYELEKYYFESIELKKGIINFLVALITFIPLFLPLYVIAVFLAFFSEIRNIGLLWFVIMFFGVAAIT